ncbi:MAG: hypothetical protein IAE93_09100 [Ignavibacteria bacterium]|nr:hypothetical protein [Ignavibacteria bacterium]
MSILSYKLKNHYTMIKFNFQLHNDTPKLRISGGLISSQAFTIRAERSRACRSRHRHSHSDYSP